MNLITLFLSTLLCFGQGNACIDNINMQTHQIDDYQGGDGMGSVKVGDIDLVTKSPNGLWKAYNIRMENGNDAVVIEGPHGFKKQLAEGSPWTESFSPDSTLFLYVDAPQPELPRGGQSIYVYRMATDKIEELTNSDPNLSKLPDEQVGYQQIGEPADLLWNKHTITFTAGNVKGFEQITIDIDTKETVRVPYDFKGN